MKEYIEREAALAICEQEYQERLKQADWCGDTVAWNIGGAIKGLPAADVVPVRHGRWDKNGRCTLCGGHAPFWAMASTYYKSPWCHECGARMDKEET